MTSSSLSFDPRPSPAGPRSRTTPNGAPPSRRQLEPRTLFLMVALLGGCVDPMDLVGVEEVNTEVRQQQLQDDQLSDKHPTYDPGRTVVEELL